MQSLIDLKYARALSSFLSVIESCMVAHPSCTFLPPMQILSSRVPPGFAPPQPPPIDGLRMDAMKLDFKTTYSYELDNTRLGGCMTLALSLPDLNLGDSTSHTFWKTEVHTKDEEEMKLVILLSPPLHPPACLN